MLKLKETSEESITKGQGVGRPEDSRGPKELTVMENANTEVSQMQTFSFLFPPTIVGEFFPTFTCCHIF